LLILHQHFQLLAYNYYCSLVEFHIHLSKTERCSDDIYTPAWSEKKNKIKMSSLSLIHKVRTHTRERERARAKK
jgi:hypothetical protein